MTIVSLIIFGVIALPIATVLGIPIQTKAYFRFTVLSLFCLSLTACSEDDYEEENPQEVTRWECILFGSYPANEVVSGSFNAVDDYALEEGDVIVDATLYTQLEKAEWTDNDMEIDGKRYHRLNATDAVSHRTDQRG